MKYILLILLSATKFVAAVPVATANFDFTVFETILFTSLSGVFGVFIFAFLSDKFVLLWNYFYQNSMPQKYINQLLKKIFNPYDKPKKKFTFSNKMIIRVKSKAGLIGLCIITPILLSIPLGTFLAYRFFPNHNRTLLYLTSSVVCWSIILSLSLNKVF